MTCPQCTKPHTFNMSCTQCQAKHINMISKADAKAWLRKLRDAQGADAMNAVIAEAKRLKSQQGQSGDE